VVSSLLVSQPKFVYISHLSSMCHMHFPSHSPWFNHKHVVHTTILKNMLIVILHY
jgi:hypothetical protein